jgi:hypothetical protein
MFGSINSETSGDRTSKLPKIKADCYEFYASERDHNGQIRMSAARPSLQVVRAVQASLQSRRL